MSLISKIATNTFWQVFGKILGTILGLVTVGLMTRYLGQAGFGYYTTIVSFLQFFGVITDFGLQMTATKALARPGANENKIISNIFTLRLASAIVFLGGAAIICWFLPYPMIVKQGIAIGSLSFVFISLQSVLISVFQKNMSMAKVAWAEIWGRLILLGGVYSAITGKFGLLYIIMAVVVANLVNWAILHYRSRKYVKVRLAFDWTYWLEIWHASWPLAITISLSLVYFRADTLILSFFRPASEVGIYGASYKVLEVLIQFPYLFLGVILPLLSQFFVTDKKIFQAILQKSFDFLMIIALPMIFAIWALGDKVMTVVAGSDFAVSGDILKILIVAAGAIYVSSLFGYTIVACELQKKMIKFYLINAVISLILYLIFIPMYSYWGAAVLTVLTELVIMFSSLYILKKHVQISLKFKVAGKALAASAIMLLVLWLLNNQGLFTLMIIGGIVYFGVLYMLRGVSKSMIREIVKYRS
ncbi:MAG: flippase [Patescibacteria group bacterium]